MSKREEMLAAYESKKEEIRGLLHEKGVSLVGRIEKARGAARKVLEEEIRDTFAGIREQGDDCRGGASSQCKSLASVVDTISRFFAWESGIWGAFRIFYPSARAFRSYLEVKCKTAEKALIARAVEKYKEVVPLLYLPKMPDIRKSLMKEADWEESLLAKRDRIIEAIDTETKLFAEAVNVTQKVAIWVPEFRYRMLCPGEKTKGDGEKVEYKVKMDDAGVASLREFITGPATEMAKECVRNAFRRAINRKEDPAPTINLATIEISAVGYKEYAYAIECGKEVLRKAWWGILKMTEQKYAQEMAPKLTDNGAK